MYEKIKDGTIINIQGLDCCIPPAGYVVDMKTKELRRVGIYSRSENIEEQYWERIKEPDWYWAVLKQEDAFNKKRVDDNAKFFDERYEEYKQQEWDRRLHGFWFMNNGKPVYLVGAHYLFLQHIKIDVGSPKFRTPDLDYFYFLQYVIEDPNCMGMLEVTKRRFGKTFRGGVFVLDYPTRTKMTNGTIQSKTGADAKKVFAKAVVDPFKKLPRFFKPEYDLSGGVTPKSELRFQNTNVRGKKAEENLEKEELGSLIDFYSADALATDGQKIHRKFDDEWAKCFAKGTKIRMYDGSTKNIEDVTFGDLVMGDDSTPRLAMGITNGIEEMYEIVPNKGEGFVCNKSHILSLSVSDRFTYKGCRYFTGDIIELTVREYLESFPKSFYKKLSLYRTSWELPSNSHIISPYMLGVWLGDGNSRDFSITSVDKEIISSVKEFAFEQNLNVRLKDDNISYHVTSNKTGTNHITKELRKLGVLQNKRIPKEYLIDSRENRLQLLAGLIDTDGYSSCRGGFCSVMQITQKRKELAEDIKELATSLGFFASLNKRISRMKRTDGTVYSCDVYKVCIYGDIDLIPNRVERKKAVISRTKNRRNPLKTGFSVKSVGVGEYFGFTVDRNNLFLLADGTVVHNTTECNIYDRHDVTRYCLMDDEGRIIGKVLYSSTVEVLETEKDGVQEAAINLWNDSDQLKKGKDGRTASGLYRFFMTASRAKNFNIYGEPDVEKTIKEILADRETVKHNQRSLAARIRKEPLTIREAFYAGNDKCEFNAENINNQIQKLEDEPVYLRQVRLVFKKEKLPKRFPTEKDKEIKKVGYMDDEKGGWLLFEEPLKPNSFDSSGSYLTPTNKIQYQIGVDTTQNRIAIDGSNPSIVVFKKSLIIEGEEKGMYPVAMWVSQTRLDIDFDEEVLKACMWYGCTANYEIDRRTDYYRYFCKESAQAFLEWTPKIAINPLKRNFKPEYGTRSGDPFQLAQQLQCAKMYVDGVDNEVYNGHVHRIVFPTLLKELLMYNHLDRQKSDQVVGLMMALLPVLGEMQVPKKEDNKPISILPTYKINLAV